MGRATLRMIDAVGRRGRLLGEAPPPASRADMGEWASVGKPGEPLPSTWRSKSTRARLAGSRWGGVGEERRALPPTLN